MGYGEAQMKELEETINATDCDLVLIATPIDLGSLLKLNRPSLRATYKLGEEPSLRATYKLGEEAKVALKKVIEEKFAWHTTG